MGTVRIWSEIVHIPTYGVGEKEKNPMFFEKRVYQGSSGKVYPHPVIDRIEDERKDRGYTIVFLENEFTQVQVMPEVGGRIYRAVDKTNGYDYVYHNRVMKPALVGLTGPWVSGGIEFNWPQHHRPNTFGPVEYRLDDSDPAKKTVWLSEIDRMYGTKVTTGITLREGVSAIEISCELYNPTAEAQTFLWWANPAVAVHERTQSIFPPDVNAVMDHGKRDLSRFPIATGTYYKMDYSSGVDISRYSNIPVPTSYMAYHSDFDFVGGYDWRAEAGVLHVADHHVSPGKKQWTWGCGEFGEAWDRNLTDEDGPYVELMTGVFTDNQPDFTWLAPYSGKRFTQYFMPYKKVGEVKIANKDVIAALQVKGGRAYIKLYGTRRLRARVTLERVGTALLSEEAVLSPNELYEKSLAAEGPEHAFTLTVEAEGMAPLAYTPKPPALEKLPEPAKAIAAPDSLPDTEALWLAGMHLEQYRHATFEPDAYYLEGLKRSPSDIRINNAYGNLLLKRGDFSGALALFERARETATRHSPNPYDGEVFFNLGKALEYLGDDDKAFDAYYKACWSDAWKTQGYLKLAHISARRGQLGQAAEFAQESLYTGLKNLKARAARAIVLRLLGDNAEARETAEQTLMFDPLDFAALRELSLLSPDGGQGGYPRVLRGDAHNFLFLAQLYAELGAYADSVQVLDDYLAQTASPYAMILYARASYMQAMGTDAADAWRAAGEASPDYCFPNMLSEYVMLRQAVSANPEDARAHYYLGCFLYDKRRHADAAAAWETSVALDGSFPTVLRNLSLYYANKLGDYGRARAALERAFDLNRSDARVFYELCELYKKIGLSPDEQRRIMERHKDLAAQRDDLSVGYAELLNVCGEHKKALDLLLGRNFHPWEGGEGKVPAQHISARIGIARALLKEGDARAAIEHLEKATVYEPGFGEGKLTGAQENNIYYYLGMAYKACGEPGKAKECLERAAVGLSEPTKAVYYNDQHPHMIFYQGLALAELGRQSEARSRFNKLVAYGEKHLFERQVMDYFAVSMPDFMVFETDLDDRNRTHCNYMMGLGYLGLGELEKARKAFDRTLNLMPNHYGAMEHAALIPR